MKTLSLNNRIKSVFTLVLSAVLISNTLFATELSKMEPMPIQPVVSYNFDYLINSLNEDTFEETLPVEEWMLNPETFLQEEDAEPTLALEGWMTDIEAFVPELYEPELALEDWMLNVDSFEAEYEQELVVENWMTDLNSFIPEENEVELALEDWMMNVSSFFSQQVLALK